MGSPLLPPQPPPGMPPVAGAMPSVPAPMAPPPLAPAAQKLPMSPDDLSMWQERLDLDRDVRKKVMTWADANLEAYAPDLDDDPDAYGENLNTTGTSRWSNARKRICSISVRRCRRSRHR